MRWTDARSGISDPVNNVRVAIEMAEKRAVCLTAVDGAGPGVRDRYISQGGIDAPKRALGASDAGPWVLERLRNLAEVGVRAASLAECNAAVRSRPVVMDLHVPIRDALVSDPTDLRQPLRNRRRGDHVAGHRQDGPPNFRQRAK